MYTLFQNPTVQPWYYLSSNGAFAWFTIMSANGKDNGCGRMGVALGELPYSAGVAPLLTISEAGNPLNVITTFNHPTLL